MKRIILMTILIVGLIAVHGFADMGGHMGAENGRMDSGQGHMEGMLQGHEIRGGMMHNMGQMSRLMQQMRDMVSENSDPESLKKMSGLIQEMSEHLEEMSKMMKRGKVSEKDMQMLDRHSNEMQESYDMMRW